MRTLTAFLCLSFAVLLFSGGEAWSLPKCPGSYNQFTWTNCFGIYTRSDGDKYVGEFRDGKKHGRGTFTLADGSGYSGKWKDSKFKNGYDWGVWLLGTLGGFSLFLSIMFTFF